MIKTLLTFTSLDCLVRMHGKTFWRPFPFLHQYQLLLLLFLLYSVCATSLKYVLSTQQPIVFFLLLCASILRYYELKTQSLKHCLWLCYQQFTQNGNACERGERRHRTMRRKEENLTEHISTVSRRERKLKVEQTSCRTSPCLFAALPLVVDKRRDSRTFSAKKQPQSNLFFLFQPHLRIN